MFSHTLPDTVRVTVRKADGSWYREWEAHVEAHSPHQLVLVTFPGNVVRDVKGDWVQKHSVRSYYWPDRPVSVLEVFDVDGSLVEIYVNINSHPVATAGELTYEDYELDVSRLPGAGAQIVDEDEFAAAAAQFGYSKAFQREIYATARAALQLANTWQAAAPPTLPLP